MAKKIENLRDLLIQQGRELYDGAVREAKDLPEIKRQITNQQLRGVIDRQIEATKDHKKRIERAFKSLNEDPKGEKNEACDAICTKTMNLLKRSSEDNIRDAVAINAIQRLSHNKITGLGSLTAYAKEMGKKDLATSFHQSLDTERNIDEELTKLAKRDINKRAMEPVA